MPFRISGKNIDIGESLRGRINRRVAEAMTKYFDGGYSGHVTIGKEGFGFRTECVIHLDTGTLLEADALAADAYASADQAALRIENRLRRYKRRLKARHIEVLLCGMLAAPNLGADYGRAFDAIYPELAAANDLLLYPFFLDGVVADPKLHIGDGLHPTGEGVAKIVAGILPKAEALLARVRAKSGT